MLFSLLPSSSSFRPTPREGPHKRINGLNSKNSCSLGAWVLAVPPPFGRAPSWARVWHEVLRAARCWPPVRGGFWSSESLSSPDGRGRCASVPSQGHLQLTQDGACLPGSQGGPAPAQGAERQKVQGMPPASTSGPQSWSRHKQDSSLAGVYNTEAISYSVKGQTRVSMQSKTGQMGTCVEVTDSDPGHTATPVEGELSNGRSWSPDMQRVSSRGPPSLKMGHRPSHLMCQNS